MATAEHWTSCDGDGRESCYACLGEGGDHDCGEDCCACLEPDINVRCDVCDGAGFLRCPGCVAEWEERDRGE